MVDRRTILLGGGALAFAGMGGVTTLELGRMGSMAAFNASVAETRALLAQKPGMTDLLRYATLAPSGHNTQPWRFRLGTGRIEILPDFSRRTPVVDPDDHHLFVALGCAAETLALAAGAHGQPGALIFDPAKEGSVVFAFGDAAGHDPALSQAIPRRQSTRAEYDGKQVSAADLQSLEAAAAMPGVDLRLITERRQIDRVRDLVVAGNDVQMADTAFLRELEAWLRFSPRAAMLTGDGLFSAASGLPPLPDWLGPRLFDMTFTAAAENDKYARQIASSAGIAVFVAQRADPEHWVLAGRACQRFALQATALGLKLELATLVGLSGRRPDLVLRFGYGPALPFSARRPVAQTLLA